MDTSNQNIDSDDEEEQFHQQSEPEKARPDAPIEKGKKTSTRSISRGHLLAGIGILVGVVGLTVGLSVSSSLHKKKTPDTLYATINRLSSFDASVLNGYDSCQSLQLDLEEAVEIMAMTQIENAAKSHFQSDYSDWFLQRGGGMGGFLSGPADAMPEIMDEAADADTTMSDSGSDAGSSFGEDSYGTNNQFDGVDEADLVKSNGKQVFAAYGSEIVVVDANSDTGTTTQLLSRTQIPTDDENGVDLCVDYDDTNCYEHDSFWWGQSSNIEIASLMLHKDVLAVITSSSTSLRNSSPVLQNSRHTRIFFYDISNIPTDGLSPLTLLARKDLQGVYKTARSIHDNAHIVTGSSLNIYQHLWKHINPWDEKYENMGESEYKQSALEAALSQVSKIASDLTAELNSDDDCSKVSKIAVMLKNVNGGSRIPLITASPVLQTFTMVHSFNLQELVKDANSVLTNVSSSGIFFPTPSYTSNVMSSAEKLVIAGESYVEDDEGEWNEQTVLLVYNLNNATSIPKYVGEVPGSVLNQFSMDHYFDSDDGEDYLRIATTSWARWRLVDGMWQQVSVSENQVSVLKMPASDDEDDATMMEVVGSATGLGLDERIYAARFVGEKAYLVTFRQTDPFYTLDMRDPTNPVAAGELKILGFSNYLHPINDDLILAIGQNATELGRANGLQISLFDVSDVANPTRVKNYVEDAEWSTSEAQYDHKAFRYLPASKLLILPLYINSYSSPVEFFDGFVVYDVDENKEQFSKKFNIAHAEGKDASSSASCWSAAKLTSRSLVFDGDVMTLKGHTILRHDLETEERVWSLNLDAERDKDEEDCNNWYYDSPMIVN